MPWITRKRKTQQEIDLVASMRPRRNAVDHLYLYLHALHFRYGFNEATA